MIPSRVSINLSAAKVATEWISTTAASGKSPVHNRTFQLLEDVSIPIHQAQFDNNPVLTLVEQGHLSLKCLSDPPAGSPPDLEDC